MPHLITHALTAIGRLEMPSWTDVQNCFRTISELCKDFVGTLSGLAFTMPMGTLATQTQSDPPLKRTSVTSRLRNKCSGASAREADGQTDGQTDRQNRQTDFMSPLPQLFTSHLPQLLRAIYQSTL